MKRLFFLPFMFWPVAFLSAGPGTEGGIPLNSEKTLFLSCDGWKRGIIASDGSVVLGCEYESITPMHNSGRYFVVVRGGRYGVVDDGGREVLPMMYSYIRPELFGHKLLVNSGGDVVSGADFRIVADERTPGFYNFTSRSGEDVRAAAMKMEPSPFIPSARQYIRGGEWGIADVRPQVNPMDPFYGVAFVPRGECRYIQMGYFYSDEWIYNIYDSESETFLFPLDSKTPHRDMMLLSGGVMITDGKLYSLDHIGEAFPGIVSVPVIDLNERYVLVNRGGNSVLFDKSSGTFTSDTRLQKCHADPVSGDFSLLTADGWVLYHRGKRYGGFRGEVVFCGRFALDIAEGEDTISVIRDGEGTVPVRAGSYVCSPEGDRLYFIDTKGNLAELGETASMPEILFPGCREFGICASNSEYMSVMDGGGTGLMERLTGKMVIPCRYQSVEALYGDCYILKEKKADVSHLRSLSDGEVDIPLVSCHYDVSGRSGICWVDRDGSGESCALYSLARHKLLTGYDFSPLFLLGADGSPVNLGDSVIPFRRDGKCGFLKGDGSVGVEPVFDELRPCFSEGFCTAVKDGGIGCVNPFTGVIVPCVYDEVRPFSNGCCIVGKSGMYGIVGEDGTLRVSPRYVSIEDFSAGTYWLKKDNFKYHVTRGMLPDGQTEWLDSFGNVYGVADMNVPSVLETVPDCLWDF